MSKKRLSKYYNESITPAEVISKAIELLGPNGENWIVGDFSDGKGNYCMIGALNKARSVLRATPDAQNHAMTFVGKQLPAPYTNTHMGRIPAFNDAFDPKMRGKKRFPMIKAVMCNAQQETPTDANNDEAK